MVDEHELAAVLSDFARTLITNFSLQGSVDALVGRIVDVLPGTSAGITLISPGSPPRYIAASDDSALRYEQLQTDLREGPCLLAFASGDAVAIPDLRTDDRFPLFCPAAVEDGLGAVFTFPLRHGNGRLGALDIYRNAPGNFDDDDMAAAQTLADVVAACLTVRAGPLSAADDTEFARLGVTEGVTERRAANEALRRSEELHRSAMETMSEGMYVLSADGRVLGSNAAARRLLNAPAGELTDVSFVHQDGSIMPASEHPTAVAMRGGTFTETVVGVLDASGARRWLAASSQPLRRTANGRPWAAVCTISDVTDQREAARLNEESVGVVSHEMRTPLTSIKGALDLMAAGATGELTDPAQKMLGIAALNTERLLRLVNGMLDLERIDSGPLGLTFADADLSDLVRQAVEVMGLLAERAGVQIVLASPRRVGPVVSVDSDRIIQTITNLLSNAVKFSPPGRAVMISIDSVSVVDSVVVRVVDHGRGVPPEMLEQVFTRFRQVEVSDACGGKGTGLGLAICRSIIDGHHGRIWMEPTPGGGATCVFTLPLHSTPMPSIALPVDPEGARRSTADPRQSILGQEVAWQHVA